MVVDRLWELAISLIPPQPPARGPGGRLQIEDRTALEDILPCSIPAADGDICPRPWAAGPGTPPGVDCVSGRKLECGRKSTG